MTGLVEKYRRLFIIIFNSLVIIFSYYFSFLLRFDFEIPHSQLPWLWSTLPVVLAVKLLLFSVFGLHQGWWKYIGMSDLLKIIKANGLASLTFLALVFIVMRLEGYPRSIFIMDFITCVGASGGARFLVRAFREWTERAKPSQANGEGKRILIAGAGTVGVRLAEEIKNDRFRSNTVVGFLDDDRAKRNAEFKGVKVLGRTDDIKEIAGEERISEIIIAIPSASPSNLNRIVASCEETKIKCRILPSYGDFIDGRVLFTQVRDVSIEDLLGREEVKFDSEKIGTMIEGADIIATGAAGSIGSELCRQIARHSPSTLYLLDHHENGLFVLERELKESFPGLNKRPIVGDICDANWIGEIISKLKPKIIFHAAAYKHVPLMEENAEAAIRNNILGTWNLARAAMEFKVEKFVNISTDKAVNPISVMGVTKRITELFLMKLDSSTKFMSVRFGNVLGSNGSVIPIFMEQIEKRKPITITHPEVTRFFMTIPEAVHLVLEASVMGSGGEIFVLDMGEPLRIKDLAMNLVRLSGLDPERDVAIKFTGLRPGEKMTEKLFEESIEFPSPSGHKKIMVINTDSRIPEMWDRVAKSVAEGNFKPDANVIYELMGKVPPRN